jgi:aspartate-semialdehyde dehydrogenase
MDKIPVGVLGATGAVGQMFISLLERHPWFEVTEVAASERSAGKSYEEAMRNRWNVSPEMPDYVKGLMLKECKADLDCKVVFSALDANVAMEIEQAFAKKGYAVSSNARTHRMEKDVPLLIPEINWEHAALIEQQKKARGWKGFIITNGNCSTIQLCLALKPLYDSFGLEQVMVTTMQALSGAGYPGVPSLDIIDNMIPFIGGEEAKMESEPLKILGKMGKQGVTNASFKISAQCNRVAVKHGHMESVSVKLSKKATPEEMISAWEKFNPLKGMGLPTAPNKPTVYLKEEDRPQPRYDTNREKGMASIIGRLRVCPIMDYKFVVLGHNLIRGAAGSALLNAEMLMKQGYLKDIIKE